MGTTFDRVLDSGVRQEFDTGSRRDTDKGKGRPDLIPTSFLRELAAHFEHGAVKYGDNNWQKGQPLSRYYASAFRHLLSVKEGKEDENHAIAAVWNLLAIRWTLEEVRAGRLPVTLVDLPYSLGPEGGAEVAKVGTNPGLGGEVAWPDGAKTPQAILVPDLLQKVTPGDTFGKSNGVGFAHDPAHCQFCFAKTGGTTPMEEHRRWCKHATKNPGA